MIKERLIRPNGFHISEKAEQYHGISNAIAEKEGGTLADVLTEFMSDVEAPCMSGATIVSHNLEFDAGIIMQEFMRCDLGQFQTIWSEVIPKGFCTMDPELGKWLYESSGLEEASTTRSNTMKLDQIVKVLIPMEHRSSLNRRAAGACAYLHVMLYQSLLRLTKGEQAILLAQ